MHFHRIALLLLGSSLPCLLAQEPQAPASAQPAKPAKAAPKAPDFGRSFFGLKNPADPEAAARGQKLFVSSCGFCHGSNANGGNSGPDLVRSVLVLHDEGGGAQIGPVILNGRVEKGMPKFPFSEAQIKDIAQFLLERSQSAVNRMNYKILNVVTGNADAGHTYFQTKCSACHSADGDLAHIAAKFDPVALQSRFLYPHTSTYPGMPAAKVSPRAQVTATVTLADGKTYTGVLRSIHDFNVSIKGSDGKVQSWPIGEGTGSTVQVHDPLEGHVELIRQYTDADMHNILAYLETLK